MNCSHGFKVGECAFEACNRAYTEIDPHAECNERWNRLAARVAEAEARVRVLEPALLNLVATLDALMAESTGVAGLHKNCGVATWAEIGEGGVYESWLGVDLGRARQALAPAPEEGGMGLRPAADHRRE